MADATIFEREGKQAAAIVTAPFVKTGDSMARRNGFPDYRYCVTPHPIGNLRLEQTKERAREILPEVLEILGVTDLRQSPVK